MAIDVGSVVEGKVTGITNFGAFIELDGGETGLVHISEVADTYVKDINNFLKLDQLVKVKVISVDDDGKIGLSIKALSVNKESRNHNRPRQSKVSFEDQLAKFLKDSEERQSALKRNLDKRSRRRTD